MATLELEGRIKTKLPSQSGTNARGTWIRQDFVLEYQDGSFPAEACFSTWGQDKVDELARFQVGDSVKVSFNVRAREYSGRWYNDLRVWRISQPSAAAQAPASYQAPAPAPSYQAPEAPMPTAEDMPLDISTDDLPF